VQHHLDSAHGPFADSCHIGSALLVTHESQQAEHAGEHDEQNPPGTTAAARTITAPGRREAGLSSVARLVSTASGG
jgi:hypothetical protein